MSGWSAVLITAFVMAFAAQDSRPVFRATSELVLLDVQVIQSKTNAAFGDLQARDFDLSEDGVPQKIVFFGRDRLPLSVVFLFDLTQSDRRILRHLAAGAQDAVKHLKPDDEAAVMVYSASARLIDGFTSERGRTVAAIARASKMTSDDAAFFNEAMYQSAAQLENSANPSGRRVILWLTDNLPNLPTSFMLGKHDRSLGGALPHTEEEAIHKLHEVRAVVTSLLLKDRLYFRGDQILSRDRRDYAREHPKDQDYSPGDAYKYAEITGGFPFQLRGKKVEQRLAEIIDSLRARYIIGYRPGEDKPTGTFCRVKVELAPSALLRPQEWRALVRAGYYRR
jgi:VWFA-related protein